MSESFKTAIKDAWLLSGGESGTRLHNFTDGVKFGRKWSMAQDPLVTNLLAASDRLGGWMSAALEDKTVCTEMKTDIEAWFKAFGELRRAVNKQLKDEGR